MKNLYSYIDSIVPNDKILAGGVALNYVTIKSGHT